MYIQYVYTQLFGEPNSRSRGARPLAGGWGQRPQGLALDLNPLGRRSQRKGRRTTSGGLQRQREAPIRAAHHPEQRKSVDLGKHSFSKSQRAADWPSETWRVSAAASVGSERFPLGTLTPKPPRKMPLTVWKPLTIRPLPQSQQQCTGTLSLPARVLTSASLRKLGKPGFPNLRNLAAGCGLGRSWGRRGWVPRADAGVRLRFCAVPFSVSAALRD